MSTNHLTESDPLKDTIESLNLQSMCKWAEDNRFDFNSKRKIIYSPQCELVRITNCRHDDPDPNEEKLAYFWGYHHRSLFILVPEGEVDVDQFESRDKVLCTPAGFSPSSFTDIGPGKLIFPEHVNQEFTTAIQAYIKRLEAGREEQVRQREKERKQEEKREESQRAKEDNRQEEERREYLRRPGFFDADLFEPDAEESTLIEEMLPLNGVTIVAGDWSSFKTTLALDWAAHLGYGLPWQSRPVSPRLVLFYSLEGSKGVTKRLRAVQEQLEEGRLSEIGEGVLPVKVLDEIPEDEWDEEVRRLHEEAVARLNQRCQDSGLELPEDYHEAPVVFVDTLSHACRGVDRGPAVVEFIHRCIDLVREGCATHVVILHHTTKTGDEFGGDRAIVADTDALFYCRRKNEEYRFRLVCDRMKDLDPAAPIELTVEVVPVGQRTTVVIDENAQADPKLLGIAATFAERMSSDELRDHLRPHATGSNAEAHKKSIQRMRKKLLDAGLIKQDGEHFVRLNGLKPASLSG